MTRAIHDVKATDLGLSKVRFKAEVDFDGRVVTRSYLEKQDIEQILNVRLTLTSVSLRRQLLFSFPSALESWMPGLLGLTICIGSLCTILLKLQSGICFSAKQ